MNTLPRLLSELVRRHGSSVAREPLASVTAQIGRTPGAAALDELAKIAGAQTLGRTLGDRGASRHFEHRLTPSARAALVDDLTRWSRRRIAGELAARREDGARRRAEGELVAERELDALARRLGVEDRLGDPIHVLTTFLDGSPEVAQRLAHLANGDVRGAALGRVRVPGLDAEALAGLARRYLERCAAERAEQARREALWSTEPGRPRLARLAPALAALAARLPSPRTLERKLTHVTVDPMLPGIRAVLWTGEPIALAIRDDEREPARLEPSYHVMGGAALVATARDVVHDPEHPLHAELDAALSTPAWRRFEAAARGALSRLDVEERRKRWVFRVAIGAGGALTVEIAEQRRSASGRWSKGSRIAPHVALADLSLGVEATFAARALAHDPGVGGSAEALFALAGQPGVVLAGSGRPLEVRRVAAGLAIDDAEDGCARPALAIGDARVPLAEARDRVRRARFVAELHGEAVLVAHLGRDLARLVEESAPHAHPIPAQSTPELLPLLESIAERMPVSLPRAMEASVGELAPTLVVRIVPDEAGAAIEIRARIADGRSEPAGEGSRIVSVSAPGAPPALGRRDLAREAREAHALSIAIGIGGDTRGRVESEDEMVALVAALHARPEIEIEWPEGAARTRYVGAIGSRAMRISVRRAAEWFGVEGTVEIDGETMTLAELLAQIRAGRRFVRLSRDRFAAIEATLRERLERAADVLFEDRPGSLAIVPASGDAVEALAEDGALRADAAWSRIRARLASGAVEDPEVPAELRAELRGYQRAGFAWLARLASIEAGGVLADDMGLGKTVQALALLVHRAALGPALVVAPTSVADNWAREAARFAPSLRVRVHRGAGRHGALEREPPRAGDLLIASYDVVALDAAEPAGPLAALELATLVLDEAQAVKNPDAQRTRAVRRLRARARVALTGTPLENRLSELWSILSLVHPGLLGPWEHFRARFAAPIERDGNCDRLAALAALVRPYLLRRTKEVVTPELPPRIEVVRDVVLSETERRLYEAERALALTALADARERDRFRVLASITRLRQLACDATLVVPEAAAESSKIAALLEIVDELEAAGRKVLVFSQFVRLLERVAARLDARGTRYLVLDGSTPAAARADRVERFQRGEATVFLLSLKAGGTGLNLTAADHVVHLDPWWNPAVEDQASDRAHRIGQERPVTIVRLVAKDTIEEAVLSLHETKRALSRGVLEGADAAGALDPDELVALIRGGERGL